jgi:DNA modification methylase
MPTDKWDIYHGDCIPHMTLEMDERSVDFVISSPPFPALYAYSSSPSDIGNTDTMGSEAKVHLSFFYQALSRVLRPGRVACIHVCQIPRMKRSGGVGLCDFRGINIRLAERAGLIYEYDWCITKNPQAQAIRTRSRELQFAGLESDRAKQRGALADYLIKFRSPGENKIPVVGHNQVTRNEWIDWAEAAWTGIRETDTLNAKEGKGDDDTKHICPFSLPLVDRCIRLFSNPGEKVFDPFTGIGSVGYVSIKLGRTFYGCELKPEYHRAACANLEKIENEIHFSKQRNIFEDSDLAEGENETTL